jgi:hypothetical protein
MTALLLDYLPTFTGHSFTLSPVAATGIVGLSAAALSTLLGGRRAILLAQATASSLFLVHFLLLGAQTGMLMCGLGLIQMTVRLRRQPCRVLNLLYALTIPAALAMAVLSWQGPASALSATGFLLATLGRWQSAVGRMRLCFILATLVGSGTQSADRVGLRAGVRRHGPYRPLRQPLAGWDGPPPACRCRVAPAGRWEHSALRPGCGSVGDAWEDLPPWKRTRSSILSTS